MSDSPLDKIKSDPDVVDALAHALEPINEHYRKLWAGTKANRPPLPSGPVEEFTQIPGEPKVIEYPPVTELAAEVARGPQFDPQKYMEALDSVLNVESGEGLRRLVSDPDSENIKGPTPYSDKSPISFYSHNQAEIDRLRYLIDSYKIRLERLRDQLTEVLHGLGDL